MKTFRVVRMRAERKDNLEGSQAEYTKGLVDGDAMASSRVIDELVTRLCSLAEIYSQVIAPSLVTIGDLWCSKDIGVAEEHLATQICSIGRRATRRFFSMDGVVIAMIKWIKLARARAKRIFASA